MSVILTIAARHPALRDGGSISYVRACGRAAIRAGFTPHIFCVGTASFTESSPYGTVHSVETPIQPIRGIMLAAHGRYIVRSIERFAAGRSGPLLIHSFGCWGGVGVEAARRLARRGIECVTAVTPFTTATHEARGKLRGASPVYGPWTRLQLRWELLWTKLAVVPSEQRGLRNSNIVLVNYDSVRRIVADEFGPSIPFDRMTYAPETAFTRSAAERVPMPHVLARLEPSDAPLILAVSRHDARKGLDVLLRALGLLRRNGVPFRACIAGTGKLLGRHRQLAAELGLASCVALPGRVPDAFDCLAHADIFALPSIEEGSGSISLLEAMQAGVAPVVSQVDGLPEDVSDGESALLVPPGDVGALARALRVLVEDGALRARIARGAQARFHARFSADAFTADLMRVYARLGFAPAARLAAVG